MENVDPLDDKMAVLPQHRQCEDCRFYWQGECRHIELNKNRDSFKAGLSFVDARLARDMCVDNDYRPTLWEPAPPKTRWWVKLLLKWLEK